MLNLANLLLHSAAVHGASAAVYVGSGYVLSYTELEDRVSKIAGSLHHRYRLEPGDRIALLMKNCPEYVELLFAAWWAGLVVVPINSKLHAKEVTFILGHSGARICFSTAELLKSVEGARGPADEKPVLLDIDDEEYAESYLGPALPLCATAPDDTAWLFYTSGTTGDPKGAQLTHRNLQAMIHCYMADVDSVSFDDRWLLSAPMSHGSGLYALPYIAKGCALVIPESGGFSAEETAHLINAHPNICSFFVPTMLSRLVGSAAIADANLAHLKTLVYGGSPMYTDDCLRALDVLGPKLVQIYGQGESPMTITCLSKVDHETTAHPEYLSRLASVGRAQKAVAVEIVSPTGAFLSVGEIGEVAVSGDTVMSGYWRDEDASHSAVRDGWLYTGDMGSLDESGYLTLKDRSKDLIISGGSNVYPREVEEVLMRHRMVNEAAVVGRFHKDWGEEIVAFVVTKGDIDELDDELDELCRHNIARFKRPREYRYEVGLPRNATGKVQKMVLRDRLQAETN